MIITQVGLTANYNIFSKRFKFVAVIDFDEVILPKSPAIKQWKDILEDPSVKDQFTKSSSLCFDEQQMVETNEALQSLADTITSSSSSKDKELIDLHHSGQHYFLTHVHSVNTKPGGDLLRPKCMHKLDQVLAVNPHGPTACVGNNEQAMGSCEVVMAPVHVARSFHYRSVCDDETKMNGAVGLRVFPCAGEALKNFQFENDLTLFKYKDELKTAMGKMLDSLIHV